LRVLVVIAAPVWDEAAGKEPVHLDMRKEWRKIVKDLGDMAGIALSLAQLALLEEKEGNLPGSLDLINQAEKIFTELGSPYAARARKDRERIERAMAGGDR
jgi:hypothetical protein